MSKFIRFTAAVVPATFTKTSFVAIVVSADELTYIEPKGGFNEARTSLNNPNGTTFAPVATT